MTRWEHLRSAFRLPTSELEIVVVRPDRLPDAEVTRVLRSAPEAHLLYRAFMQLLEETREEAVNEIATDAWNPTAMAMHAGGARYLKALRGEILRRRAAKRAPGSAPKQVISDQ